MEKKTVEAPNGLRRAVTLGLAGFILCLGLSYEVPDLAKKVTAPMGDKAWKEYLAAHPHDYDDLSKDDLLTIDFPSMSEEEKKAAIIKAVTKAAVESFFASYDAYMKEVVPGLERKEKLIEFGFLAGAGLLVAFFGLAASVGWTAIESRRLVGRRVGALFRAVLPRADFNQTLLFSSRNFKELLVWTAAWLAAPVVITLGLAESSWSLFGGLYPLAIIVGSFYIFSFWLALAVYHRRGKLTNPANSP